MNKLCFVLLFTLALGFTVDTSSDEPLLNCEGGSLTFVESMPMGVHIVPTNRTIYQSWIDLIHRAKTSIQIAAMYTSLLDGKGYLAEGGFKGVNIVKALVDALSRGVSVKIVETSPAFYPNSEDTHTLREAGAEIGFIMWDKLTNGSGGVLHTKFMVVDNQHLYVGSANYDWRSLAQIKELGVVITDCEPTAVDLSKVFEIYWSLVNATSLPASFPAELDTIYNVHNPMRLNLDGVVTTLYFAASPKPFNTPHRTNDIDALLYAINTAKDHICVSVMDYSPVTLYQTPAVYWALLDNSLRDASVRGINVKLLFSYWNHTDAITIPWMMSLDVLPNVSVKVMKIPDQQGSPVIPFTRVNHSKYMITDKMVYITTSNWTPDYFLYTGGVSLTIDGDYYEEKVREIFDRDWDSIYSFPVPIIFGNKSLAS